MTREVFFIVIVICGILLPTFAGGFEPEYSISGAGTAKQDFYLVNVDNDSVKFEVVHPRLSR